MRLAIVGSTILGDSVPEVRALVLQVITRHQADEIVSGGAPGVDTIAEQVGRELGLPLLIFRPYGHGWSFYRARNQRIAEACDALVRIVSQRSKTYGSGWTRDRAAELGKPTEEWVLP